MSTKISTSQKMAERVRTNLDHLRVEYGWGKMKLYDVISRVTAKKNTTARQRYNNPKEFTLGELASLAAYFRKPIEWFFSENI